MWKEPPGGELHYTRLFIVNNNGLLELSLNSKNAPDLRISARYQDMPEGLRKRIQKKDKRRKRGRIVHQTKIDSACWFHRRHTTTAADIDEHHGIDHGISTGVFFLDRR